MSLIVHPCATRLARILSPRFSKDLSVSGFAVIIEFEFFGINKMILKAFNVHFIEYLLKSKLNLKKPLVWHGGKLRLFHIFNYSLAEGRLYLAVVISLFTLRIVFWSIHRTLPKSRL